MKSGYRILQIAEERVRRRSPELAGFADAFPSLVQSCGLAHAVALAKARGQYQYLEDLAAVLVAMGHDETASAAELERATLRNSVTAYVRLSCNALQAAAYLTPSAPSAPLGAAQ